MIFIATSLLSYLVRCAKNKESTNFDGVIFCMRALECSVTQLFVGKQPKSFIENNPSLFIETTELGLFVLNGMNNSKHFKNLIKIHAALGKKKYHTL